MNNQKQSSNYNKKGNGNFNGAPGREHSRKNSGNYQGKESNNYNKKRNESHFAGSKEKYNKNDRFTRNDRYEKSFEDEVFDEITKYEMIEGRNSVIEALKSERTIEKVLVAKGAKEGSINQLIAIAKDNGVIVQEVDRRKLDTMSKTHSHQGVIAFVSEYKYVEIADILEIAKQKNEHPFIIILDEITDPHNLGSIIRSANSAGVHGVIIPKRRSVGVNAVVSKSSAGAVEHVAVAKVTNISQTIDWLKRLGVWVVGSDADGEKVHFESNLTGPIALIIGSEGEGIGRLIKENCDFLVKIPMKGKVSSLNAGVAGAILMYEVVRQRELK